MKCTQAESKPSTDGKHSPRRNKRTQHKQKKRGREGEMHMFWWLFLRYNFFRCSFFDPKNTHWILSGSYILFFSRYLKISVLEAKISIAVAPQHTVCVWVVVVFFSSSTFCRVDLHTGKGPRHQAAWTVCACMCYGTSSTAEIRTICDMCALFAYLEYEYVGLLFFFVSSLLHSFTAHRIFRRSNLIFCIAVLPKKIFSNLIFCSFCRCSTKKLALVLGNRYT